SLPREWPGFLPSSSVLLSFSRAGRYLFSPHDLQGPLPAWDAVTGNHLSLVGLRPFRKGNHHHPAQQRRSGHRWTPIVVQSGDAQPAASPFPAVDRFPRPEAEPPSFCLLNHLAEGTPHPLLPMEMDRVEQEMSHSPHLRHPFQKGVKNTGVSEPPQVEILGEKPDLQHIVKTVFFVSTGDGKIGLAGAEQKPDIPFFAGPSCLIRPNPIFLTPSEQFAPSLKPGVMIFIGNHHLTGDLSQPLELIGEGRLPPYTAISVIGVIVKGQLVFLPLYAG